MTHRENTQFASLRKFTVAYFQELSSFCFTLLRVISYKDHITNEEVRNRISQHIGQYEDLLTTVKKRKLIWYYNVTRADGLPNSPSRNSSVEKEKKKTEKEVGRQYQRVDKEELHFNQALSHDHQRWSQLVRWSAVQRPHNPTGS